MTALPAKNELDGTSVGHNQGVFKAAIGGLRDCLAGLFGSTGNVSDALAGLKLIDPQALHNLAPVFTVGSNALTCTVKDSTNTNLGATNPGFIGQRSATLGDGALNLRQIAANIALTVSAGSTLGLASATAGWIHWYVLDNAGASEVAVSGSFFGFTGRGSTTAEGGAGAADSGTVMYSATARSNLPYRWLCAAKAQHTTGNWTAVPTEVRRGPGFPIDELLEDATPDIAADFVVTWDTSTGTFRKAKPSNLDGTAAASDTVAGKIEIAVQSEIEAASSNTLAVTPGRMHFHPGVAKVWGRFGVAGNLINGYNISSIGDSGAGVGSVNFTTAFSGATAYASQFNVIDNAGATSITYVMSDAANPPTASSNAWRSMNYNWTGGQDPTVGYMYVAHGDQ